MEIDERPDSELVAALRVDTAAMAVLYDRHANAVHRYLARRSSHPVADELLSEVFVRALEARRRVFVHASGSALPWLYGIAANVLRAHLRKRQPRPMDSGYVDIDWDAIDSRLDASAERSALRAALAGLSIREREVLLLVAWEGLTPTEVAAALDIPAITARSRLHRARQHAIAALATQRQYDPQQPVTPKGPVR